MKELTQEELLEIYKIVEQYREVENELNTIDKEIESLFARKEVAVKTIEDLKNQESRLMVKLKEKYGEGRLDPLTMKYLTKEKYEKI
jgi:propanediol dehydratase small subunit